MRPIEEARANQIDSQKAVANLQTPQRQQAFEDLQLWWKFHQPESFSAVRSAVGRVDRFALANGESITVVFTGGPEKQKGGIYPIKADGRLIHIFQGNNYLGDNDQFVDVNGDGLPEIVCAHDIGEFDDGNPKKVVTEATNLNIVAVSSDQMPLLRIVFDVRPFRVTPTWRCASKTIWPVLRMLLSNDRSRMFGLK